MENSVLSVCACYMLFGDKLKPLQKIFQFRLKTRIRRKGLRAFLRKLKLNESKQKGFVFRHLEKGQGKVKVRFFLQNDKNL